MFTCKFIYSKDIKTFFDKPGNFESENSVSLSRQETSKKENTTTETTQLPETGPETTADNHYDQLLAKRGEYHKGRWTETEKIQTTIKKTGYDNHVPAK